MQKRCLVVSILFLFITNANAGSPTNLLNRNKTLKPVVNKDITRVNPSQLKYQRFVTFNINGDIIVKDNDNHLMWEVKQPTERPSNYGNPHDAMNQYRWHDPNPETNGGHTGYDGNGTDTKDFIDALNNKKYGGFNDWRLPTIDELRTIVDKTRQNPAINTKFFPHTISGRYWTSTTWEYSDHPGRCAWHVYFFNGYDSGSNTKDHKHHVRAVRSTP